MLLVLLSPVAPTMTLLLLSLPYRQGILYLAYVYRMKQLLSLSSRSLAKLLGPLTAGNKLSSLCVGKNQPINVLSTDIRLSSSCLTD